MYVCMYVCMLNFISIHISIYVLTSPIFETENMALEQNIQEMASHFESDEDISLKQKWKSISAPTPASENASGCFDCNICLDSAHDPVVTLCGHLYCWPCIYKWLYVQSTSLEPDQQQKCPVCKARISDTSLVPLFGRGSSPPESEAKKPHLDLVIPHRPSCGLTNSALHPSQQFHSSPFQPQSQSFHHQQYFPDPYGSFAAMPSSYIGGTAMAGIFNPMIGMFGEMVLARMFGSSDTRLFAYPHPNSYPFVAGSSSPRMRRQEMQVDKSLNRVSIFLFCCFILCLLLF
ncbi:hypothetical protein L1049_001555 [Liquidambar formosana]|uniref:E3 ubiquitin-protein ligase RMA n=1 Tax=Liquidambar formosana TaxID=63359 RepID=A0AAP0NAS3_LIQFO